MTDFTSLVGTCKEKGLLSGRHCTVTKSYNQGFDSTCFKPISVLDKRRRVIVCEFGVRQSGNRRKIMERNGRTFTTTKRLCGCLKEPNICDKLVCGPHSIWVNGEPVCQILNWLDDRLGTYRGRESYRQDSHPTKEREPKSSPFDRRTSFSFR